ncbi:hypothetical protein ACLOJK_010231 [Asimina triloba]
MDHGLIYDITVDDYLNFMCALGYNSTRLDVFRRHKGPPKDISSLDPNYPYINLKGGEIVTAIGSDLVAGQFGAIYKLANKSLPPQSYLEISPRARMSSTLLEVTRAAHEEVERLERLVVKDLQHEPSSSRERLFQNHRVRTMIDSIMSSTEKLVDIYEDKDNARKDEIAALGGQTAGGSINVFSAFYDRLKEIREYHRRHPAARVIDAGEEYEELLKEEPRIEFSGEITSQEI